MWITLQIRLLTDYTYSVIMPEEPFKNREILEMFSDVKKDLTDIKMQTTKTNGSVADLRRWQDRTIGAVTIIMLVVVPMLTWALSLLVNIDARIHSAVDDALAAYNVDTK